MNNFMVPIGEPHNQYAQLPLKIAAGQPKRCAFLSAPGVGR